jgi:arginase family enzyme
LDFAGDGRLRLTWPTVQRRLYELGVRGVLEEIRRVIGDWPFYFTLDTDGIDATYLPGTELPEPFGFTTREVVQMIRGMRGMAGAGAPTGRRSLPVNSL